MKFSICVISLVFAVFGKTEAELDGAQKSIIQARFLASGLSCFKDHPLSFSDIKKLKNKMLPDGDDAKCFAECLFMKIGIMDDMGKLSAASAKDKAMEVFKDSEEHLNNVEKFIETCSSVNDSEADEKSCDRAKLAFNCLVENAPKFGFDVDF